LKTLQVYPNIIRKLPHVFLK